MTKVPNQGEFPKNRDLHVRRRLLLFAIAPTSYAIFVILSWVPTFTETVYRNAVAPLLGMILSTISGIVPLALGEISVAALLLWYAAGTAIAGRDVVRRQRQVRNAISGALLRLARDTGIIVGLFYLLWGFNYAVEPLPERLEWQALENVTAEELTQLATETTVATNREYLNLHGTRDAGEPTPMPDDIEALDRALRDGWKSAREELGMPAYGNMFGRVKAPLLTRLYEWLGIAGYYFPFTGEGNVRAGMPAIDYPQTLAHEMAHQRGVARESEANFWGYLAAVHSVDPLARYSAYRFANRQMVSELARVDWDTALNLTRRRLPGVQRDIDGSREYWQRFRGHGTVIGSTVNDAFLRSNRVEGGVHSYSMSATLFLAYARAHGGTLVPGLGDSTATGR